MSLENEIHLLTEEIKLLRDVITLPTPTPAPTVPDEDPTPGTLASTFGPMENALLAVETKLLAEVLNRHALVNPTIASIVQIRNIGREVLVMETDGVNFTNTEQNHFKSWFRQIEVEMNFWLAVPAAEISTTPADHFYNLQEWLLSFSRDMYAIINDHTPEAPAPIVDEDHPLSVSSLAGGIAWPTGQDIDIQEASPIAGDVVEITPPQ